MNAEKIKTALQKKLNASQVQVEDESAQHQAHPEAVKRGGGHYRLLIVADRFAGKTLLERHRMVYAALEDKFSGDIHALAIQAFTPEEYLKLKI